MTNRVLFGLRNGSYGLWVSKPGFDVLTAPDNQMTILPTRANLQVVSFGFIDTTAGAFPYYVNFPNLGYLPLVKWTMSGYNAMLVYTAATQFRFDNDGQGSSNYPRFIKYIVFRQPYNG